MTFLDCTGGPLSDSSGIPAPHCFLHGAILEQRPVFAIDSYIFARRPLAAMLAFFHGTAVTQSAREFPP